MMFDCWFKIGRGRKIAPDALMNRIEKEHVTGQRLGFIVVIRTNHKCNYYNHYYALSLCDEEVTLFNNNETKTVKRTDVARNGDYYWLFD